MGEGNFLIEEAKRLLESGYSPIETGYSRLPNGHMYVKVLTPMPNCKGKMVDWWFGRYLRDTEAYRLWHPRSHLSLRWDKKWLPGNYIGASHTVEEQIGLEKLKVRIEFYDPKEIFDVSMLKDANVGTVVSARVHDLGGNPHGTLIHFVRDTDFGCEMRSRFWIFRGPDAVGPALMKHCIEEMSCLAAFLPDLYEKHAEDL